MRSVAAAMLNGQPIRPIRIGGRMSQEKPKNNVKYLLAETDKLIAQFEQIIKDFPEAENLKKIKFDLEQKRADLLLELGRKN